MIREFFLTLVQSAALQAWVLSMSLFFNSISATHGQSQPNPKENYDVFDRTVCGFKRIAGKRCGIRA